MSKVSKELREIALYRDAPPAGAVGSLSGWLVPCSNVVWDSAARYCKTDDITRSFLYGADETHARTFLLLVAEAV
jgi:hypothetical protein